MRNRSKVVCVALAAAVVLGAAVGTADARRIELSNQNIRAAWSTNKLTFTGFGGFIQISCAITLEGSFHSKTLSKVSGQLIGYITSAAVTRPCVGGEAWILNGTEQQPNGTRPTSLPWHVRYDSFEGTLPRIETIRLQLVGVSFLTKSGSNSCLYKTTAAQPAFGNVIVELGGSVISLEADSESEIPRNTTLEGICPSTGSFGGTASVTLQGSTTTRIRVRLVQ
jgi:hypothetical protein